MQLSANQAWKQSGTTLPFLQWLDREKQKENFIYNQKMNEKLNAAGDVAEENGLVKTASKPFVSLMNGGVTISLPTLSGHQKLMAASLLVVGAALVIGSFMTKSNELITFGKDR